MNKNDGNAVKAEPVDASIYDEVYFLTECEGYDAYESSHGGALSPRLQMALSFVDVRPGMRILDIGCGRGEVMVSLLAKGGRVWGIDYAWAALRLAAEILTRTTDRGWALGGANARRLPFASDLFDCVMMFDIVEHLHPWELEAALREVHRVLAPNGVLVAHTGPNLWYYRYGYPLFRFIQRLMGNRLPKDPRDRFPHHKAVHVNEQSPHSFHRTLVACGFKPSVRLLFFPADPTSESRLTTVLGNFVQRLPIVDRIFRNHIVAIAQKVSS